MDIIYEIPRFPFAGRDKNPLHDQMKRKVEDWASEILNHKWTDDMDFCGFGSYVFPHCDDLKKLVNIGKYTIWALLLDDYFDDNPGEYIHWIQLARGEIQFNDNIPLERMFSDIYNELINKLSHSQKFHFITCLTDWFHTYEITGKIKSGDISITSSEYLKIRRSDIAILACIILIEYDLGDNLDQNIFNSELFKLIFDNMADHWVLVNDLFSVKNDLRNKDANFNYVIRESLANKSSIQQSANKVLKELISIDNQIHERLQKLIDDYPDIPKLYCDQLFNLLYGCISWHEKTIRYK
jgi:hypothetical protein